MKRLVLTISLVTAIFGMSAAARADTETVTVVFSNPALDNSTGPSYSDPFAQFDPALGTLTSVTLDASGSGTTNSMYASNIAFFAGNDYLYCCTDTRGSFTYSVTSNQPITTAILSFFTGMGDAEINVQDGGEDAGATVLDVDSATITYTYTPAPTPEPGTLALLGTGLCGVAGAARRRLFRR